MYDLLTNYRYALSIQFLERNTKPKFQKVRRFFDITRNDYIILCSNDCSLQEIESILYNAFKPKLEAIKWLEKRNDRYFEKQERKELKKIKEQEQESKIQAKLDILKEYVRLGNPIRLIDATHALLIYESNFRFEGKVKKPKFGWDMEQSQNWVNANVVIRYNSLSIREK